MKRFDSGSGFWMKSFPDVVTSLTLSDFSPAGLVLELVLQLPHLLLNNAYLLGVYEHCVLLETQRNTSPTCP